MSYRVYRVKRIVVRLSGAKFQVIGIKSLLILENKTSNTDWIVLLPGLQRRKIDDYFIWKFLEPQIKPHSL